MTEKKKTYHEPVMKVVVLGKADIIATSQFPSLQNESYEEEDEAVTSGWFNN